MNSLDHVFADDAFDRDRQGSTTVLAGTRPAVGRRVRGDRLRWYFAVSLDCR